MIHCRSNFSTNINAMTFVLEILSLKTISDSKYFLLVNVDQYDVYGNLFGLLAAHPVTPLVSLHHLDVVEPIFPNVSRVEALQRLMLPAKLDSAGIMQQSICYDKTKSWTISVSWGFAVQILRGIFSPREMEMPSRTFLNWYRRADYTAYAFNTRPVSRNPCQKPFVFYMSRVRMDSELNQTVSEHERHRVPHPLCRWKMADPDELEMVIINKKPDPHLWNRVSCFSITLFVILFAILHQKINLIYSQSCTKNSFGEFYLGKAVPSDLPRSFRLLDLIIKNLR